MEEIMNTSHMLVAAYLVITDICDDVVQGITMHSVAKYSAGFGGSNALHGKTVTLCREMVGPQLPMMVQFNTDPTE